MKKLIVIIALAFGAAAGTAHYVYADDAPAIVDRDIEPANTSPEHVLIAQADTGSGSGSATAPTASQGSAADVPAISDPLTELAAVKAKYDALLAARKDGSKDLLWFAYAALAAAVIRTLLSAIKTWRGDKPTGWVKWAALGLAVPLALLTYYAAGAGLWAAIVMAGAGPGAVIVNELLKKKPAEAGA